MAQVTMKTLPRDDWNTAFDIENIKANMVFPTEAAWTPSYSVVSHDVAR